VHTDNKHLVAAVFGGKTAAVRNAHMRMLLFRGLETASTEKTRKPAQQLIALPRPAAKPPASVAADVAWTAQTKQVATQAVKVPKAPAKVAAKVTPPAPAQAPAPAPAPAVRPTRDAISQVLAQGDAQPDPTDARDLATASTAPSAHPPRLDLQALREAMSSEPEPVAAQTRSLQASAAADPQDIASLIRNSIVEGAPEGAARQPSTLDSQANALATAATPAGATRISDASDTTRPSAKSDVPPSYLKGPMPTKPFSPAPLGQGYEIQIGAYGTVQEAQSKLEVVRGRAVGLLEGHSSVTLPVQRDDRQIFRARFVHFDETAASNTCLELRRLAIDCFVMRAD
jgi:D-alanyl-D-alanine carboxypeptidase